MRKSKIDFDHVSTHDMMALRSYPITLPIFYGCLNPFARAYVPPFSAAQMARVKEIQDEILEEWDIMDDVEDESE